MCQESDTSIGLADGSQEVDPVRLKSSMAINLTPMLLKFVLTTSANFRFFLTQSDSLTVSRLSSATAPEETTATLE